MTFDTETSVERIMSEQRAAADFHASAVENLWRKNDRKHAALCQQLAANHAKEARRRLCVLLEQHNEPLDPMRGVEFPFVENH